MQTKSRIYIYLRDHDPDVKNDFEIEYFKKQDKYFVMEIEIN